jgi:hypothetical protein
MVSIDNERRTVQIVATGSGDDTDIITQVRLQNGGRGGVERLPWFSSLGDIFTSTPRTSPVNQSLP